MITFTCSCGKKYQLPDRNAGREVRCNQCGKTLTVPAISPAFAEKGGETKSGSSTELDSAESAGSQTIPAPFRLPLSVILIVVLTFFIGTALGFFAGINFQRHEQHPMPIMAEGKDIHGSSADESMHYALEEDKPSAGETAPAAAAEEEKKEESGKEGVKKEETPKKDKKSAVLDELGTILSEDKK